MYVVNYFSVSVFVNEFLFVFNFGVYMYIVIFFGSIVMILFFMLFFVGNLM